ncbi:MAG: hypothetical protein ACRDD2_06985 [Sarcina sp.]
MLESGVDGEGSIICNYDSMEATVIYSKISNSYIPSEIQGEEGTMIIDRINTMKDVKIIYRDGTVERLEINHSENDMCYEVEEFIKLIEENKLESKVNSLENSKIVMEIMDSIRRGN